jgi:hypothetical protein
MDTDTYRRGKAGPPLRRRRMPETPWAPGLREAMRERGVAVHEESLLEDLLADLGDAHG